MTKLNTISLTLAALALMASPAMAQDTYTAKLTHSPSASIEDNYASMEKQANRFCKRQIRRDLGGRKIVPNKLVEPCVEELMQKAVAQINSPYLTAYHNQRTGTNTAIVENKSGNTQER